MWGFLNLQDILQPILIKVKGINKRMGLSDNLNEKKSCLIIDPFRTCKIID